MASRFLTFNATGYASLLCALFAVSFGLYVSSAQNGFISIDDGVLVTQNVAVQSPLSFGVLRHIFTSYDPELYAPLTTLSCRTDFSLGGLDPAVFHLHNVLLHVLNVLLVFWLLLLLRTGRIAAFLGAVLFAVHPLNAEAVLWVAARKDLLSTMFGLLACICFLGWASGGHKRWYWLALAAFSLGLLAKVSIVLLPLFLLLVHPDQTQSLKKKLLGLSPFFALSILFVVVAVIGKLRTFGAVIPLQYYPLLAAKATVMTLGKAVLPLHLSLLYPQMTPVTLASLEFASPVFAVVAAVVLVVLLRRRLPFLWRGAVFFALAFAPSFLSFTRNGELFVTSDHHAYLAFVGVALIAGVAAVSVYRMLAARMPVLAGAWRVVVGSVLAVLCLATYSRIEIWRTDESVLRDIIAAYPEHALAYGNLGVALLHDGKNDEAEQAFRAAIGRNPHFILPRMNLAGLLLKQGHTDEAMNEYRNAISAIDRTKPIRSDDLTAYYILAESLAAKGDTAGSLALYREAASLGTDIAEAQYNEGVALQKVGNVSDAEAAYRRAIGLDSGLTDAHFYLADILAGEGKLDEAASELEIVAAQRPDDAEAAAHLANIRDILQKNPAGR